MNWLPIGLAIFVVSLFLRGSLVSEKIKKQGSAILFRGSFAVRILLFSFILISIFGSFSVLKPINDRTNWVYCVIFIALGFGCIFLWPREIKVDIQGINQQQFIFTNKIIKWSEIDYGAIDPVTNAVKVFAKDGTYIVHTSLHSGRVPFLDIVKKHCRVS